MDNNVYHICGCMYGILLCYVCCQIERSISHLKSRSGQPPTTLFLLPNGIIHLGVTTRSEAVLVGCFRFPLVVHYATFKTICIDLKTEESRSF